MPLEQQIVFGSFRLDLINECLWRNEQAIALPPKEFQVLLYLVRNPGRLVTKDELIEAVWPETTVTDGVLKVSIRKIRATLDDDSKSPQFIETAHRRGYRFIGQIENRGAGEKAGEREKSEDGDIGRPTSVAHHRLSGAHRLFDLTASLPARETVGRETALAQMWKWSQRALSGEKQMVFVTGEAGIGKTTLVEAFLQSVARDQKIWVGQGQCLEQYGACEAYLPVLEAISRMCQEPGRERLVELLRCHAPTWLLHMPWLMGTADRENLQREVIGATRERMMREMAEALEALTSETPLVLVLEDLHWSDYSTLDLVSYLARRRKQAKLMIVATYRPVELALSEHPLKGVKQELQWRRQCEELPLEYLSQGAISEYLTLRFPQHGFPAEFTTLLHGRTEGNPFFMVNAVDYLQAERVITERDGQWRLTVALAELEVGVPESIRHMIEKQIERLDREQQRVMEVAAVAGAEFPSLAIAVGLEQDLTRSEEQLEEIERRHQFLRATGVSALPNGVVTARYAFIHALYQEVLYQRVAVGRRARVHRLIAESAEEVYGERAGEIAAELAMHFEHGHDFRRAVKHMRQAAQNHSLRYANREAIAYLSRALNLVGRWPEPERVEARIAMREQVGLARLAMGDMAGAAEDFAALADYAQKQGRTDDEAMALDHLATALSWVDRERCLAAAERFVTVSRGDDDELLLAHARGCWGYWQALFHSWSDEHAEALAQAITAVRRAGDRTKTGLHLARLSFFECLRSEYSAACRAAEEGAQIALELRDAICFLLSQYYLAWGLLHLGQWGKMRRILSRGLEMAERNEHTRWTVLYRLELAWLHEQALDFESARAMCEQAHEQALKIGHPYTELLSLILLGVARLGLGQPEAAFRYFREVAERMERERSLMDWILRFLLHDGLSRYWLARGELEPARREAEALRELAAAPGERTYLALAHRTLAEIAMAAQKWDDAENEVSPALSALEGVEAPLAEWRVCETAAQLYEQLGRAGEADRHWRRSADAIVRLVESLGEDDHLRESLTANPSMQAICRKAKVRWPNATKES
ncbi:MAG TPA: AAA family ATPase [Blastocatellia bacterium]|nr:AAA family ATPase [Blastocatellia bacterium]